MDRMPKSVTIDAVKYNIIRSDDVLVVGGTECSAYCDYDQTEIRVRSFPAVGAGREVQTLMHEIVHGILFERGLDEQSADEKLVDGLASGIINLIRSNPKLVAYVVKSPVAEESAEDEVVVPVAAKKTRKKGIK